MPTWAYEFKLAPREPVERGEVSANSEEEARRKLRVLLAAPRLPPGTKLVNLSVEKAAASKPAVAKVEKPEKPKSTTKATAAAPAPVRPKATPVATRNPTSKKTP